MENYELTLAEFIRIARKRKWIIGFAFCAVVCATVLFTNMRPSVYEASVKIMVEKNDNDQGALVWDIEPNLNNEVQIIKSFPIMRALTERIEKLPSDPKEREQAIVSRAFEHQSSIKVEQLESSNIIAITATGDNPRKVAGIANTLADVYITEDVAGRQKQAQTVLDYVQKELDVQRERIIDNEARMHAFKQNELIFIVTPKKKAALDRMSVEQAFKFEKEVLRIDDAITAIAVNKAARAASKVFAYIAAKKPFEDVVFIGLNRRLLELEFERFLLLIDYTKEHPQVKAKTEEIEAAKQHMRSLLQEVTGLKAEESEEDLTLVVDELFLEAQKEVLVRIINKSYEETGALSSDQLKYLELKREMENTLAAYERLLQKKEEASLSIVREIATITVISPATEPKAPISPNKQVNYMIGVLIGILFALMVGFAAENIDTSISTIEDVEKNFGLSVMGTIPFIAPRQGRRRRSKFGEQRSRLVTVFQPLARESESFKTFRTNLVQVMRRRHKKVLLFTSAMEMEGKSTVAANVAVAMAELGLKTILVGANLRRPTMHKFFGINREPGLSDILMGKLPWQEAVRNAADLVTGEINIEQLIHVRGIDNLRLITAGTKIANPSEALDFIGMDRFLSELRIVFDVVIIDSPPVLPVTDALTLASKVDGVMLVYRVAQTKRDMLKRAKLHLENVGADICGVVLNDIKKEEQLGSAACYFKYDYAETPALKAGMFSQSLNKIANIFI